MIKKILSISSWAVHGAYALLCLTVIVFCALYSAYYPANFEVARDLAGIALFGVCFISFVPLSPIGLGLNTGLLIAHIIDKKERKASKIVWQSIRTVLSTALCIALWMITVVMFVEATGGV